MYILNESALTCTKSSIYCVYIARSLQGGAANTKRYDANALQGANFVWNLRWIPLYRISLDWFSILIAVICLFSIRQSSVGMFFFSFLAFPLLHQTQNHTRIQISVQSTNVCKQIELHLSKHPPKKSIYPSHCQRERAKTAMATDRTVFGEVSFEIGFGNV